MESCKIYLVLFWMLPALSLQISIRGLQEETDLSQTRSSAPIWTDVSGACIQGRNEMEGIVVSSLADCKRRCETETSFKCRSIDYLTTENKCNLSQDNRQSAGTDYKQTCHVPNYDYSEITQEANWIENGTPCTGNERQQEQKCRETFINMNTVNRTWIAGYQKKASDPEDQKSYDYSGTTAKGFGTKGCYGYNDGIYKGHYFFGLGGTEAQRRSILSAPYFRPECKEGWGSITHWSTYKNIENEKIFCEHADQSYIVQAKSRWNDEDDDNKQIAWHCSPPDTNVVTGDCRDFDNWSHEKGEEDTPETSQQCPDNEVMVGITKSYFVDTGDDDWKYKIRCCKLGKDKSPKPGSCQWNQDTRTSESEPDECSGCNNYSEEERSPRIWDENVYFTGMKTEFKEWRGSLQNRVLQFRTCEFGCKVTNIEILEKPKFVAKGWKAIGRQAIFDCESNSINFGMANEEAVENSVDLTVSEDYSHEVNGAVTVSAEIKVGIPFVEKKMGLEISAGYSHTWTKGKSQSKGKAFSTAVSTSMDKTLENESGVAAWIVMYTQNIEYKESNSGSGWKLVRARYTRQCGSETIIEEGTMRIEAQKFTNLRMDIERMDFDTRRECRDKRRHVGKSEFQRALLNEWGLEGGQDFPSENSVANNLRRAFWTAMKYEILEPCGKADRSFLQTNYGDITKTSRCMFDDIAYDDINSMERCKEACSEHGLNMVAYLPNDNTSLKSSLSSNPEFSDELEPLKTKYPGCFIRKDPPGLEGTDNYWGDRCIWNGQTFDGNDRDWTQKYWPVDKHRNYYPLCKTKC